MGTIRVTSSVSGTLDGTTHAISGSYTMNVAGMSMETTDVTTSYTLIQWPRTNQAIAVLLKNDGDEEVKVRILRLAATEWDYYHIPPGGMFTVYSRKDSAYQTDILEVGVRAVTGTSRVIAHVAWI